MRMLRIGHCGAAGTAPENTIASMKKALATGVDAAEFAVHRTAELIEAVPAPTRSGCNYA